MATWLFTLGALQFSGVRAGAPPDPINFMTYLSNKAECSQFLKEAKIASILGSFEREYKHPSAHVLFAKLNDFAKINRNEHPVAYIDERSDSGCLDVFESVNVNNTLDTTMFGKKHKAGRNLLYFVQEGKTSSFRPAVMTKFDSKSKLTDFFKKGLDEAFKTDRLSSEM
jgi:hypothetical protein